MTRKEANLIVKKELGPRHRVWRRGEIFFLGYTIKYSGKEILLNKFVSSQGYRELLRKAGIIVPSKTELETASRLLAFSSKRQNDPS
jgi:hypothetical protein